MSSYIEIIAEKDVLLNGEPFMTIMVLYDKISKCYEIAYQYDISNNIRLSLDSDMQKIFYETYKDKEKVLDVFDSFKATGKDVGM